MHARIWLRLLWQTLICARAGEENYRIYVLVNSQTVIADEFVGSKMYPLFVQEGDNIEVHGYSELPFTVTLEDHYKPVETETGIAVEISYTVPGS